MPDASCGIAASQKDCQIGELITIAPSNVASLAISGRLELRRANCFMTSSSSAIADRFYTWNRYRCAYSLDCPEASGVPLLLVHPIGVGLSRWFWERFCREWRLANGSDRPIYNPDLLGCGESDLPRAAYGPQDWAAQLHFFLKTVVRRPAIVVVQGGCLPIALALWQQAGAAEIAGFILSGPPAWEVMTRPSSERSQTLAWNLFDSPLGWGFYQYARRRAFLDSFSRRQLFASPDAVDAEWLDKLQAGAKDSRTRHAVFSFLSGFWRQDWTPALTSLAAPTLALLGEGASSISRTKTSDTAQQRLETYCQHLPNARGEIIMTGRNVLPYENTREFVRISTEFARQF